MFRRVAIIVLSLVMLTNLTVLAEDGEMDNSFHIITTEIFKNISDDENSTVTRGDCITIVMKLIGVDNEAAGVYANMDTYKPIFLDVASDDPNAGYIYLAQGSAVAIGVKSSRQDVNNFEPERSVTVKECLAFMLRCLKDSTTVEWENIMIDSEEIGLLKVDEVQNLDVNETITSGKFKMILERMLNLNRYLYWPKEEPSAGYSKSMQVDQSNSIRYIDWILQENK